MGSNAEALEGAFSSPVFQSQDVFRTLMDGMSRPGRLGTVLHDIAPPRPFGVAAAAIVLTLCDHDTPVWLSAGLAATAAGRWIAFHTGAPVTDRKDQAHLVLLDVDAPLPPFSSFFPGTQEYPDRSATLVVELAALSGGRALDLSGPGIRDTATIAPAGLPETFLTQWGENRAIFPRGVDLVLTAGRDMLCLPRTTRIAAREA